MTSQAISKKPVRTKPDLSAEIEQAKAKLKALEERQKAIEKDRRERNVKAVHDWLKTEKLDQVDIARWTQIGAKLTEMLGTPPSSAKPQ